MKIIKVTVVESYGQDTVNMQTDLPCPYVSGAYDESPLSFQFTTTKNMGASYVRKHFGVEPEIININEGGITQEWGGESFEI